MITGGTGFVGKRLIRKLENKGHQFVILTRSVNKAQVSFSNKDHTLISWDGSSSIPKEAFNGVQAAINLVGENISNKRWSEKQKEKIKNSRTKATQALVDGLNQHAPECKVLVSASAVGIYPINREQSLDEESPNGKGFLPEVCKAWEDETKSIRDDIRVVITRIGVVLGKEGGAVSKLYPIFKLGGGGPVGSGKQMMSWIHVDDLVSLIEKSLENQEFKGVYNAVSPKVVSNKEFSKSLAKALSRPCLFPVPPFMLKLLMGEMSTIVLDSQNISSQKLVNQGFEFQYKNIDDAMKEIAES